MKIYKYVGADKDKNEFKNFMKEFFAKIKYKCKIIYNNKIITLQSLFKIPEYIIDLSKFKLIFYNDIYDINEIILEILLNEHIDPKYTGFKRIKIKKI